jgi:hypothetical protein
MLKTKKFRDKVRPNKRKIWVKNNQVLQKDKKFPKNETFMQLNNEKK